jgi:ACR3 family arsenite transporter
MKALSSCGLILFLFAMSFLHGDRVVSQPGLVLRIATVVLVFMCVLFALSGALGTALRCRPEDLVALKISTAAKNNAVALALAYSAFGADAALVNAISGPLVQLPILLGFIAVRRSRRSA